MKRFLISLAFILCVPFSYGQSTRTVVADANGNLLDHAFFQRPTNYFMLQQVTSTNLVSGVPFNRGPWSGLETGWNISAGNLTNSVADIYLPYGGAQTLTHFREQVIAGNQVVVMLVGDSRFTVNGGTSTANNFANSISNSLSQIGVNALVINGGVSGTTSLYGVTNTVAGSWGMTNIATFSAITNIDLLIYTYGVNDPPVLGYTQASQTEANVTNEISYLQVTGGMWPSKTSYLLLVPYSASDAADVEVNQWRGETWVESLIPAYQRASRQYNGAFWNTYVQMPESRGTNVPWMDIPYPTNPTVHVHPTNDVTMAWASEVADFIMPQHMLVNPNQNVGTLNVTNIVDSGPLNVGGASGADKKSVKIGSSTSGALQIQGAFTAPTGTGVEISYGSGIGEIDAYDRTHSSFTNLQFRGRTITFAPNNTTAQTLLGDGSTTFAGVVSNASSYYDTLNVGAASGADVKSVKIGNGTSGALQVQGAFTTPTGIGLELSYGGGVGEIDAYDRTHSSFTNMQIRGRQILLAPNNTLAQTLLADGSTTFGGVVSNANSYYDTLNVGAASGADVKSVKIGNGTTGAFQVQGAFTTPTGAGAEIEYNGGTVKWDAYSRTISHWTNAQIGYRQMILLANATTSGTGLPDGTWTWAFTQTNQAAEILQAGLNVTGGVITNGTGFTNTGWMVNTGPETNYAGTVFPVTSAGFTLTSGANAHAGTVTLVTGFKDVADTTWAAGDYLMLTCNQDTEATAPALTYFATNGVGFLITNKALATSTSAVVWLKFHIN